MRWGSTLARNASASPLGQLGEEAAAELGVVDLARVVRIARRDLLGPGIQRQRRLRDAARPQAVDQHPLAGCGIGAVVAAAAPAPGPVTDIDLHARVQGMVRPAQWRILEALTAAHPEPLDRATSQSPPAPRPRPRGTPTTSARSAASA